MLPPNLIGGKTILTNNMTQHTKETLFMGNYVFTLRSSSPRTASVFDSLSVILSVSKGRGALLGGAKTS